MKIKKSKKLQQHIKSIFRIRWWLDLERIRGGFAYLTKGAKTLLVPQKPQKPKESFNAAATRLHLNAADLEQKSKSLRGLSLLMCLVALCMTGYTIYQILYGSYHAAFLSVVLTLFALVLAFRYHFWYFQIRSQKLGCSISEWYQQGLLSRKGGKKK